MLALADVAVTVKDAKAAALWWKESLGFETHTIGAPGGHALLVAPPGDRFLLHLCEGYAPVEPGNSGIAFLSDDIVSLVRRMKAAGVSFTEPFTRGRGGGSAKFSDPDGNVFWLIGAPTSFIVQEAERRAPGPPPRAPAARHGRPRRARRSPATPGGRRRGRRRR